MLVGLARKSAAKSNEELVNQKYATPHCSYLGCPLVTKFSNYYDVLARNTFRNHCEVDGGRFGRCAMRFPLICHAPIFVIGVPEGAQHMQ